MLRFLLRRLATAAVLVFLLLTVLFFLLHLAPGEPAVLFSNPIATAEQRAQIIRLFQLDRPLWAQYLAWLQAVFVRWDWGSSYTHLRPVTRVLAEALPNTLILAAAATIIEYTLAFGLGVLAARRRESWLDHAIRGFSLLLFSVPIFWLGLMSVLVFSDRLGWLPAGHMYGPGGSSLPLWQRLPDLGWHLVLPAVLLGVTSCGVTIRVLRTSLLEVLGQDYVRTARAKGLSARRVLWVHALRNAAGPLAQLTGLSLPLMLNGSLALEVVFSWPGVGRVLFEAISSYDYPLILAGVALSGVLVTIGSLLADLLHAWVDPRVRDA